MSIQNSLNQIINAIFGKDVRQAIYDAIKQCYDDASINHDNANMEVKLARGSHSTLNDRITENEKNQEKLSSDLEHIAQEAEKPISLDDCDEVMLGAIQNKEGETTFNLLSIPREKSVDYTKIKDTDFYSIDVDWSSLTRKSDSTGNWGNNVLYKKGFVKNITLEINSENNETGKIFVYKAFNDGTVQVVKSYDVTGKGKISVNVNRYIEHDFYITTKIANVRYDSSTTIKSASLGDRTNRFTPNFSFQYCFAVGVNYNNIYNNQDKLLFDVNKNLFVPCSLLPTRNGFRYPITFDFTTKTLTISELYIVDTSTSFKTTPGYNLENRTLIINDLPAEGYYVIYLVFDTVTKEVELLYSNGESLLLDMKNFNNKVVICYGLTDGQTYFSFGGINDDYVKVIVKYERNVDNTLEDDKIIPKYAEKKIITSLLQKNRWFAKKANIIGDSVIKGENSADSYKRMKDDNVASILMEEFGFSEVRNYGIGGSRITSHSDATFPQKGMVDRYVSMNDDSDLNIVSGGTNDFGSSIELGTLSDLSDNTKFKPALYNLLKGMQDKYPGKELYFIIPTHRNDKNPDNKTNSVGLTLKDYVNACYEVCELLSVEVIDMWKGLGFSPHVTTLKNQFMPDGLHPSIRGMREYYGKKICKSIK